MQYWHIFPMTAMPLQLLWQIEPNKNKPPEQPVQLETPELKHDEQGDVHGKQSVPEL